MDHIKNALLKPKIPPKNDKAPTFFAPKNTNPPSPKKYKNGPTDFPLKKYKITPK
jgi:hypothetical protein